MDALVELPLDQWPELQEKLLNNWPRNMAGYYALKKNREHPGLRESFQLKVYCPHGNMDNGFIAKSLRGAVTTFIMFSVSEDTSILQEALATTKLINWSDGVFVNMLSYKALQILHNLQIQIELDLSKESFVTMYYLDGEQIIDGPESSLIETTDRKCSVGRPLTRWTDDLVTTAGQRSPMGTRISAVKQEDLPRVNNTWYQKLPSSITYFARLASNGFSYGLYSHDELLAWVFTNEYNFIRHLYCEDSHRKKGYAEYLIKYLVNDQLRLGNDVYCFIENGNSAPEILFKKLGFKKGERFYYVDVNKPLHR